MEATKACPECAEQVQADAKVCRYCSHRFMSTGRRVADGVARLVVLLFAVAVIAFCVVAFFGPK